MQGYSCLRSTATWSSSWIWTTHWIRTSDITTSIKGLPFLESPRFASISNPTWHCEVESLQKRRKKISALIQLSTHRFKHAMHIDHSFIDQPKTAHGSFGKSWSGVRRETSPKHLSKVYVNCISKKCCNDYNKLYKLPEKKAPGKNWKKSLEWDSNFKPWAAGRPTISNGWARDFMNIKLSMNSSMVMPGWGLLYFGFFISSFMPIAFQRPQVYISKF